MHDIKKLAKLCQENPVYIQTHNFPDPDAIASAYGLQKLLRIYGIEAELCYDGRIDQLSASKLLDTCHIRMSPYENLVKDMRETDKIICVDMQKYGGNATDLTGDEFACIDHHPTFVPVEYQYQDIRIAGACATLIAEYYALSGNTPDSDTATALLYGIKMDTLQFTRGVTELDIKMFAYLFPLCDQERLTILEKNKLEFTDLKACGAAIKNITLYDKVGFSYIPFSCPDALVAIISDFMLSLAEIEVAVVYSFRKDGVKLSVRSENPAIHAGNLLHTALKDIGNGGGHASMGGGFISRKSLPEAEHLQTDYIRNLLLDTLAKESHPALH